MTESYVAEFTDGPLEGETDHRLLSRGVSEERIGMMAAVDGLESLFWYERIDERHVGEVLHVRYAFVPADSDPAQVNDLDGTPA